MNMRWSALKVAGVVAAWLQVVSVSVSSASVRGLSQHTAEQTPPKGDKGHCTWNQLTFYESDTINKYNQCIRDKAAKADFQIAGMAFDIQQRCWCENKVQEKFDKGFGCCKSADYAQMCETDCNPDCSTPEAQSCIEKCPALCLESDYQPSFCDTGCKPCTKYLLCSTGRSINRTGTHPDHPKICDDLGFEQSGEWKNWTTCWSKHPKRTHWNRKNAESHCYCESNLKKAAETHKCCGASWGKTICDEDCAQKEQSTDCKSKEATDCLQMCKQTCHKLYPQEATQECKDKCIAETSTCAKYVHCEPAGYYQFNYICDNYEPPASGGCCRGDFGQPTCPSTCNSSTFHKPSHNVAGYVIQNQLIECHCEGCPEGYTEAVKKYNATLIVYLFQQGAQVAASVARSEGLVGPSKLMNAMILERNNEIKAYYETLEPRDQIGSQKFQDKMKSIMKTYEDRLIAEAKRQFKYGDPTPAPVVITQNQSGQESDGSSTMTLLIIIAGSVLGTIMLTSLLMVYRVKVKQRVYGENQSAMPEPYVGDGDGNVVMGRPVEQTPVGVSQGAPVPQTPGTTGEDNGKGGKGQDDENNKV